MTWVDLDDDIAEIVGWGATRADGVRVDGWDELTIRRRVSDARRAAGREFAEHYRSERALRSAMRESLAAARRERRAEERQERAFQPRPCVWCGTMWTPRRVRNATGCSRKCINHIRWAKAIDELTGRTFGRLVVLGRSTAPARGDNRGARWDCRCVCGVLCACVASQLRKGLVTSCGCAKRERLVARTRAWNARRAAERDAEAARVELARERMARNLEDPAAAAERRRKPARVNTTDAWQASLPPILAWKPRRAA